MAMLCCTKLETAKERCPIVFQGHPSNFKVTRYKTSPILTQIGRFGTIGRSQLSNPSDLPCFFIIDSICWWGDTWKVPWRHYTVKKFDKVIIRIIICKQTPGFITELHRCYIAPWFYHIVKIMLNIIHPSRRGYHAILTDVFSPCLARLKINFPGIPMISSLYILWAGRICPCVRRTWVHGAFNAPAPCHWGTDTHTALWTRGRWHGERTLKVPRRHDASTLNVPSLWDFLRAIRCVGGTAVVRDVRCRYGGCRITFRPQSAAGNTEFET